VATAPAAADESASDGSLNGRARDADVIMGDNANIFRLVGIKRRLRRRLPHLPVQHDWHREDHRARLSTCSTTRAGRVWTTSGRLMPFTVRRAMTRCTGEVGNDLILGNGNDDNLYGGQGDDNLLGGAWRRFPSRAATSSRRRRRPRARVAQPKATAPTARPRHDRPRAAGQHPGHPRGESGDRGEDLFCAEDHRYELQQPRTTGLARPAPRVSAASRQLARVQRRHSAFRPLWLRLVECGYRPDQRIGRADKPAKDKDADAPADNPAPPQGESQPADQTPAPDGQGAPADTADCSR